MNGYLNSKILKCVSLLIEKGIRGNVLHVTGSPFKSDISIHVYRVALFSFMALKGKLKYQ